jgi:hypothetical protein
MFFLIHGNLYCSILGSMSNLPSDEKSVCPRSPGVNRLSTFGRKIILFSLAWDYDFTHVNDQHTKLKRITSCIQCTYRSCLTTFVHGFMWMLNVGNSY